MTRLLFLLFVMPPVLAWAADASVEVEIQQEAPRLEVQEQTEKDSVNDDEYVLRLSLPTQADLDAWQEPGIRVTLGWIQGRQYGTGPAPDMAPLGAALRPWLRISPHWSVGATFSWQASAGGFEGLKWGATVEPSWHPWRGLALSLGLGYGGLLGRRPWQDREDMDGPQERTVSRTLGDDELLSDCSSGGWLALARVEYQFVVGPLFSTGPFAQVDMQQTGCEMPVGNDPETGKSIVLRQWWMHRGFNLGWWATWR